MEHNLHCDEKFDQLPPSYSAVMAEKELDSLNINWKNKCYLDKIDEMNSFDIAQDALNDKLLYMNDLLEKLIQEAEVTLQTVPCSVKKKKRYTNYALLQSKYIESQQKLDMTLKEIMKTIDTIIPETKPHYTSSLSSFVHNAVFNIFSSTKQSTSPPRRLKSATKVQAVLFITILIVHTFDPRRRSRWTKRGHDVLSIWKHRPKTQYQFWLNRAQLTLFIFRLVYSDT
ncbi:hypothetical protein G6F56_010266 [Rhizopus delemar]|nr:hypothetical protein G6F56_010266 [Rhizopus delemar]